jgi:O-antigen/teichoic acid export membrane protein
MHDSQRFRRDLIWNIAAMGVLGVSGMLLNIIIGRYYGPEVLGVFHQVLVVYYILSQLAVGGFVYSSLHFTAEHVGKHREIGNIVAAALILTAALAAIVCSVAYFSSGLIGTFFDSPAVSRGILMTIPGLFFFALNKILLFSLNGLRHMRVYAVGNAIRFLFILLILLFFTFRHADGSVLPACISAGEIALFPILLGYFVANRLLGLNGSVRQWMARHFHFGFRSFLSGMLMDVNFKVDVLMLGYFASDRTVGIYGFASMIAEGLYQLVTIVQTNWTPILSKLKSDGRMHEVRSLVRRNALYLCPTMAVAGVLGSLLFPYFAVLLTGDPIFAGGWVFFAVLMTGITLASSYLPFSLVLNQWGYPVWFMVFLALTVASNLVLNIVLIGMLGSLGAAVATAITLCLSVLYLKTITRLVTGVRL